MKLGVNRRDCESLMVELVSARRDLVSMLETLDEGDWDKPTLCAGWRVRDVVSHVACQPDLKTRTMLTGVLRTRDRDALIDKLATEGGDRDPVQILANLRRNIECTRFRGGTTPDSALVEVVVHSLDIAYPNGWDIELPADRARLALSALVTLSGPHSGKARATGFHLDTTDIDWRCGCGDHVRGPANVMLLALAGRPVCDQLTGQGVPELAGRH
ncbi:MAG: maleylpyruvate isomerase family mycothiol-dependent enzyme [Acidimicrobiales bacterium]